MRGPELLAFRKIYGHENRLVVGGNHIYIIRDSALFAIDPITGDEHLIVEVNQVNAAKVAVSADEALVAIADVDHKGIAIVRTDDRSVTLIKSTRVYGMIFGHGHHLYVANSSLVLDIDIDACDIRKHAEIEMDHNSMFYIEFDGKPPCSFPYTPYLNVTTEDRGITGLSYCKASQTVYTITKGGFLCTGTDNRVTHVGDYHSLFFIGDHHVCVIHRLIRCVVIDILTNEICELKDWLSAFSGSSYDIGESEKMVVYDIGESSALVSNILAHGDSSGGDRFDEAIMTSDRQAAIFQMMYHFYIFKT